MKNFKIAALANWEAVGSGEVRELEIDTTTTVKFEVIANGPMSVYAQAREGKPVLVGCVESDIMACEIKTAETIALMFEAPDDVNGYLKLNRHDYRVKATGDKVFTEIAPKRRQNDALAQMMQVMKLNEARREKQFHDEIERRDAKWEKRFKALDRDGDGEIEQHEMKKPQKEKLNPLDKDGDGKISQDEFKDGKKKEGKDEA